MSVIHDAFFTWAIFPCGFHVLQITVLSLFCWFLLEYRVAILRCLMDQSARDFFLDPLAQAEFSSSIEMVLLALIRTEGNDMYFSWCIFWIMKNLWSGACIP